MPLRLVLENWDQVVERWQLVDYERSMLLGGFRSGDVADIHTYGLECSEKRMRLCIELAPILETVFGDLERARAWLRTDNRNLMGSTPLEMMGRSPMWIRWLVDNIGVLR